MREVTLNLDLENSSWAKSIFKGIDFVKKAATTVRPDIAEGTHKKGKILFLHQIVDLVKEKNIPPSVTMNFDLTPLKYASVTIHTLTEKGSKHVGICDMTYRKCETFQ